MMSLGFQKAKSISPTEKGMKRPRSFQIGYSNRKDGNMKEAPPIIGALEFACLTNEIILVEHDEEDHGLSLLTEAISGKNNIIFSNHAPPTIEGYDAEHSALVQSDSIYKAHKIMRAVNVPMDFYIIHRIDLMDLLLHPRERGARISAYLSMMTSRKILQGANVLITSAKMEYKIREIANRYINLRK